MNEQRYALDPKPAWSHTDYFFVTILIAMGVFLGFGLGILVERGTQDRQADRVREWMIRGSYEANEISRAINSGEIVITNEQPFMASFDELKKLRRATNSP